MHEALAEASLRLLQSKAKEATGTPLDVGALADVTESFKAHAPDELTGEGREPVELAARVIAHVGRRLPGAKRVAKVMEGRDARAGIGADLSALVFQLVERNEATIKLLVARFAQNLAAKKTGETTVTPAPDEPFPGARHNGAMDNGTGGTVDTDSPVFVSPPVQEPSQ